MAVTNRGIAVLWGITVDGMSVNGAAVTNASSIRYASQGLSRSTGSMEHVDNNGEVIGFTTYNQTSQLSLECYPSQSTLAAARTLRGALPVPGDRVTLADSADASNPIAGEYICDSAEYRTSNSDKVTISLTLRRWAGITDYTPRT